MTPTRPLSVLALAGVCTLAIAGATGARTEALTPREEALHILNRLGFGPRPGDVERVLAMGRARWIADQLHPERIPDASVDARLAGLETLTLSNRELIARFETPLREARKTLQAERAAGEKSDGGADDARRILRARIPPESRPRRVLEELTAARILRGAESQRQLQEVLVDFWMNHFNVYAAKKSGRVAITSFERDTIRPRIWGKFEDLLLATAASPAMLAYLDNARSVAAEAHRPAAMTRRGANASAKAPRGLNENYARELMELHTLGVDGGYSQADVTELARILTGWSVALPRGSVETSAMRRRSAETAEPGTFVFRARLHDSDRKTLLGTTFAAGGGIEEGERAIRLLARHPSTARHLSYRLCQRLVADEPPAALVQRVALRFEATGGDLRETVRAIVESPEFFDPRHYRAKVKSPFEYVVSAVRAGGGSTDGRAIAKQIAEMGQPLYLCQPPTGYAETAEAWINSGALLARLNFAIALAEGQIPGTSAGPIATAPASAEELGRALAGSDLSAQTLETIRAQAGDAGPTALTAGLVLGSPEFQKQ